MTHPTTSVSFAALQPIRSEDASSGFRCEEEALNAFFRQYATQQGRRGDNRTWVLHRSGDRHDLPLVLGFYTLAPAQVERSILPSSVVNGLPRYPIAAFLIGRLARDERCKGMGIGEYLLDDAHRRVLRVNAEIGGLLVIVDAKNAHAATFYEQYGYKPFALSETDNNKWPQRFYVKMAHLQKVYSP